MFTQKIRKIRKMNGGIPIYPGGYSCIFKPQLKCKTRTKKVRMLISESQLKNLITKITPKTKKR